MYCKNCGVQLNDSAVFCSSCGAKVIKDTTQTNKENGSIQNKPDKAKSVIGGIIAVIVLAIIIGISFSCCGGCDDNSNSTKETGHTNIEAWTAAQLEVERNLKSPSTAKFPWSSEGYVTKIDNNTFDIQSYVDSENSFGAMIRTNFSCTVKFTGQDTYIVQDLEFWQ